MLREDRRQRRECAQLPTPCCVRSMGGGIVGKLWAYCLYRRRPEEIARKIRRHLERERLAAQYREEVENHFKRLGEVIRRNKIDPEDIWNSDQKGFQIGSGKNYRQVVYCDARRLRANKVSGPKGLWISLHESINAGGHCIPPRTSPLPSCLSSSFGLLYTLRTCS